MALTAATVVKVRRGNLVDVSVSGDDVVFRPRGVMKVWAVRSEVVVAASAITTVRHDFGRQLVRSGLRAPGTHIPGLIKAGTYRRDGQKTFWLVGRGQFLSLICCPGQTFDELVLELNDDAKALLSKAGPTSRTP